MQSIYHWDGSAWSEVRAPSGGYLESVAMIGPNDGWAVGGDSIHWDGQAWTSIPGGGGNAVDMVASDDGWSVRGNGIARWSRFGPPATTTAQPSLTPKSTATSSIRQTPRPTWTLEPTRTPRSAQEATPEYPTCVCEVIYERAPRVVISDALANPDRFYGWRLPLDQGKPPSPGNPLRECLSLTNVSTPYHFVWNAPIWRVGCP
jgi:hypothetical protein